MSLGVQTLCYKKCQPFVRKPYFESLTKHCMCIIANLMAEYFTFKPDTGGVGRASSFEA